MALVHELQHKLQYLCRECQSQVATRILQQLMEAEYEYLHGLHQAILSPLQFDVMKLGNEGWKVLGHKNVPLEGNHIDQLNSLISQKMLEDEVEEISNQHIMFAAQIMLADMLANIPTVNLHELHQYKLLAALLQLTYFDVDKDLPIKIEEIKNFIKENQELLAPLMLTSNNLSMFVKPRSFLSAVEHVLDNLQNCVLVESSRHVVKPN